MKVSSLQESLPSPVSQLTTYSKPLRMEVSWKSVAVFVLASFLIIQLAIHRQVASDENSGKKKEKKKRKGN